MNAAIRAVTRTAIDRGAEVIGVRRGFAGLIEGDFAPLSARDVSSIIELAGTVLESARSEAFRTEEGRARAVRALEANRIDGVIVIGGNGSQTGSLALSSCGVPVNGVASTIDNDLAGTEITIGVDTAVNVALEAIDRLRVTAASHHRMFIVEVMGRDCGYLALVSGIAGGAEVIVTPEHDLEPSKVLALIHEAQKRGKRHAMVVVAEGAKNGAQGLYQCLKDDPECCLDPRLTILGHIQRGGRPSAFDRLLATRLAAHATDLLLSDTHGLLVGLNDGAATSIPLADVAGKQKPLPAEFLRLAETMQL
jgi:6-phosphofructokinase 1